MALSGTLQGTLTALYTPFAADGSVDLGAFEALCDRVVAGGSGLVPCGTTGETPTLKPKEIDALIRTAARVAGGRVPVIAGTGSASTAATIASTRRAAEAGADAALVVTPPYNKPPQISLLAHFRAVAAEGGLPIVLYNVPSRTGCNLLPETALELAEEPAFIAVKEASNLGQVQTLVEGAPEGFTVLSGDDILTLPLIALGGHGVISVASNLVPAHVVALVDAARAGDLETARAMQAKLLPLFRALFRTANPIPLKHAASLLGHARLDVRLPLTSDAVTPAITRELAVALEHAGTSASLLT